MHAFAAVYKHFDAGRNFCVRVACLWLVDTPAIADAGGFGSQGQSHWPVMLGAIVTAALIIIYLLQNRRLERRTAELRRELFERQIAEKELLASDQDLRRSLAEKEALLKEIHHRVKNNLQIVSSLFYLQEEILQDSQSIEILRESQNRVKSMALIHEQLYSTDNLARIDFGHYLQGLTANLFAAYGVDPTRLLLNIEAEEIFLEVAVAVPCGLIVNELVSNAIKHAFPENSDGTIRIRVQMVGTGQLRIEVADDGVGMAAGPAGPKAPSLGLRLIDMLTRQFDGQSDIEIDRGTRCTVVVNIPEFNKQGGLT